MKLALDEVVNFLKAQTSGDSPVSQIVSINTDTRKIKEGDLYIALKGDKFDGHDFVDDAFKKGAIGCVVSDRDHVKDEKGFFLLVEDTLKALGDIACLWRKKCRAQVIGLTGSSGKTTTKEMLALALDGLGKVCKTKGNLNNLVGLPLSLVELKEDDDFGIFEMGMNAPGEIARLAQIADPDVGVITNVGQAHLEGVGSIEGVAKAKGELFAALRPDAIAVVNLDDKRVRVLPTRAKKITFGRAQEANIRCDQVSVQGDQTVLQICTPDEKINCTLPVVGDHYIEDWLAAFSVTHALGLDSRVVVQNITHFKVDRLRGEVLTLNNGTEILNDTYNANPDSVKMALMALKTKYPSKHKFAVLGDMLELGQQSTALHNQVGQIAAINQVERLYVIGDYAAEIKKGFDQEASEGQCLVFAQKEDIVKDLLQTITGQEVVLIKGSRGMRLEQVADGLKGQIK